MDKTRKNTLKFVFGNSEKVPVHLDVLRFTANVLKIPATDVHSIYRDENDRCFYLKFMDQPTFDEFTGRIEEQYRFVHSDGQTSFVRLDVASRLFRYVRIFNLPPEVEERDISAVMTQFGNIRQHVRERYPVDYGYSVYSGVRGVHMEIAKEIPPNLYIGHFKARLYYEGLKNRCFYCKQEGRIKVNCPKVYSLKSSAPSGSYSGIVCGALAVNNATDLTLPSTMTTLNTKTTAPVELPNPDLFREISPIRPRIPQTITEDNRMDDDNQISDDQAKDDCQSEEDGEEGEEIDESSGAKTITQPVDDNQRMTRSLLRKPDSVLDALDNRSRSRSTIRPEGKGGKAKDMGKGLVLGKGGKGVRGRPRKKGRGRK